VKILKILLRRWRVLVHSKWYFYAAKWPVPCRCTVKILTQQESRAVAREPRDAAAVVFG